MGATLIVQVVSLSSFLLHPPPSTLLHAPSNTNVPEKRRRSDKALCFYLLVDAALLICHATQRPFLAGSCASRLPVRSLTFLHCSAFARADIKRTTTGAPKADDVFHWAIPSNEAVSWAEWNAPRPAPCRRRNGLILNILGSRLQLDSLPSTAVLGIVQQRNT